jgi:TRAP-type C4-dicarboxylate transport system permease small subunit
VAAGDPPGGPRERGLIARVERGVLAGLLGAMVLLAGAQIALRNLFDTGISWADPLLRAMVLWLGLLGAVAASRRDRQISVDALSRALPRAARRPVHAATSLFTSAVAGLLAWHGGRFVLEERSFGSEVFAGLPAWPFELVIPLAFGGMALLHLGHALAALRGRPPR